MGATKMSFSLMFQIDSEKAKAYLLKCATMKVEKLFERYIKDPFLWDVLLSELSERNDFSTESFVKALNRKEIPFHHCDVFVGRLFLREDVSTADFLSLLRRLTHGSDGSKITKEMLSKLTERENLPADDLRMILEGKMSWWKDELRVVLLSRWLKCPEIKLEAVINVSKEVEGEKGDKSKRLLATELGSRLKSLLLSGLWDFLKKQEKDRPSVIFYKVLIAEISKRLSSLKTSILIRNFKEKRKSKKEEPRRRMIASVLFMRNDCPVKDRVKLFRAETFSSIRSAIAPKLFRKESLSFVGSLEVLNSEKDVYTRRNIIKSMVMSYELSVFSYTRKMSFFRELGCYLFFVDASKILKKDLRKRFKAFSTNELVKLAEEEKDHLLRSLMVETLKEDQNIVVSM